MSGKVIARISWLFAVSLALNLGLLLAAFYFWRSPAGLNGEPRQAMAAPAESPEANKKTAVVTFPATVTSAALFWNQIATSDYRKFIANLRALQCPEPTIQDIIIGLINRQYAPRLAALRRTQNRFWEPVQRHVRAPGELKEVQDRLQECRRLEAERNDLVRDLFGFSADDLLANSSGAPGRYDDILDDVKPQVRAKARELLQRYDNLENDVTARTGGTIGLQEQRELDQLYRTKVAELRQILTPTELEEYEVRYSPTASMIRQVNLVGFNPTEQEFRAIFRAINSFGEQYPAADAAGGVGPSEETKAGMLRAAIDRDDQIHQALGDARYADYKRSNDATYRGLIELTDHFGVSQDVASQVHALRESILSQTRSINQDPAISEGQRESTLAEIRRATEQAVSGALGEQAYQSYVNLTIGQWIGDITRGAAP